MKNINTNLNKKNTLIPGKQYVIISNEDGNQIVSGTFEGFFAGNTEYMNVFKDSITGEAINLSDSFLANEAVVLKSTGSVLAVA